MKIDNLTLHEEALIDIIRTFGFLKEYDFSEKEITINFWSYPSLLYCNKKNNRYLYVCGNEISPYYDIIIKRKRFPFLLGSYDQIIISDYYNSFGSVMIKGKNYTLNTLSNFIQKNLMPVIQGEMWIDELLKQKRNK